MQNLPVREVKPLPHRVLPCAKHEKTPEWQHFECFPYTLRPGWFHDDDLEETRAWLHERGCSPKVSLSHKAEVRKLSATLPDGVLKVFPTPEALAD